MKKIVVIIVIIFVVIASFLLISNQKPKPPVTSYEDCVEQGNPILESYPPQCKTTNGQTFIQDIGNELEKKDLITSENPRPNQRISSPVEIKGKARGTWFFEASFPIKLLDDKGNIIAEGHAEAEGEWMTEEFVPYRATLEFATSSKQGNLILEKDNPSGLPENADQLEIPVKF